MKKIWFGALIVLGFLACEKDDICDGGDSETPNVVISMFDYNNSELLKPAAKVCIIADNYTDTIVYKQTSRIELPLQITTNETGWRVLLYQPTATNDTIILTDHLNFNYQTNEVYVSKACGYKVNFTDFSTTKDNATSKSWIQSISLLTNEIINEDNAHVQLFY